MPTDPIALAARPAFLGLLKRLRGGEGPCPACKGTGELVVWERGKGGVGTDVHRHGTCRCCSGSGRVAVPPDPGLAPMAADWWQDHGGDLAGLLVVYALGTPRGLVLARRRGEGRVIAAPEEDDSLRPVLCAWDAFACPARAAAVRGLRVSRAHLGGWYIWCDAPREVAERVTLPRDGFPDQDGPAARLALKAAALRCYDPGGPFDGGAGVPIPMRAEGARLTVQPDGEVEQEFGAALKLYDGLRVANRDAVYRLDGARVGAPPGWEWTPHALPGGRLAITWECRPSDLLPAAGAETPAGDLSAAAARARGGPPPVPRRGFA
jgi:hypothetical protein